MLEETKKYFKWNKKKFSQFLRASYTEILNNSRHKLLKRTKNQRISIIFYTLIGCPMANFGPLLKGHCH